MTENTRTFRSSIDYSTFERWTSVIVCVCVCVYVLLVYPLLRVMSGRIVVTLIYLRQNYVQREYFLCVYSILPTAKFKLLTVEWYTSTTI